MLLKKVIARNMTYRAQLSILNDEPSNQFYGGAYPTSHRRKILEQMSRGDLMDHQLSLCTCDPWMRYIYNNFLTRDIRAGLRGFKLTHFSPLLQMLNHHAIYSLDISFPLYLAASASMAWSASLFLLHTDVASCYVLRLELHMKFFTVIT
jgi:hypothetical protein